MNKIEFIDMRMSDIVNGGVGVQRYKLSNTDLNNKDDVIDAITELITHKLVNTGLNLNMKAFATDVPDVHVNINIDEMAREVAIYFLLEYVNDQEIGEDLIDDEITFIKNNFDLEKIVTAFSDADRPKLIPVRTMDKLDHTGGYDLNAMAINSPNTLEER